MLYIIKENDNFTSQTKNTIMKKIKATLFVAVLGMTPIVAQQSVSNQENKWEKATTNPVVTLEKETKVENDKSILMYPNPAKDLVTLQRVKENDQIIITDVNGKKLLDIKAQAEVEIIPIDFLESGNYMLLINNEKRKLVVE